MSRIQLAAIFMAACFMGLSAAAPLRAQDDPVRLGLVSFVGEATNLFALEAGLFEANGLNVEVVRNQAGVESLLGVMSGELDIATVAVTPVVYAAMGRFGPGREFDVVASILNSSRLNQVVAAVGSGIEVPSDISGKRVGVTLGTASEFLWDLFALAHGIEDVEIFDVPVNRLAEAIAAGQLDAAVAWAPYHEEVAAAAPGGGVVFYPGQIYTANWLVVVDSDFAQRRPEDVTRYLRALLAAEEVVRSQPELVARTVAPIEATAPEELLKLYDIVDFDLELSEAVLLNLSLQAAWAVRRGYVPQDSPADMRALFNVEHLRRVKPNAVLLLD